MKYVDFLKKYYPYIIVYILLFLFVSFIPLKGIDWSYLNTSTSFLVLAKGHILPTMFLIVTSKIKIFRVLMLSVVTFLSLFLFRNIVDKKNNTLIYISLFLLLLISKDILNGSLLTLSGFANYFLSSFFLLLVINYLGNNKVQNQKNYNLLIVGVLSSLIMPLVSFVIFFFSGIKLFKYKKEKLPTENIFNLFIGSACGLTLSIYSLSKQETIYIPNIIDNLLHNLIPLITGTNNFIYIITTILCLALSYKIFSKSDNKTKILTALASMTLILFNLEIYFLKIDDLSYVLFLAYHLSIVYIIEKAFKSKILDSKIKSMYNLKFLYLIIILFDINLSYEYLLFSSFIDIILILEIISRIIPNKFLEKSWFIISIIFLFGNIYVSKISYDKIGKMDEYIKHNLECNFKNIKIPAKYKQDYFNDYLPLDYPEKLYYLNYLEIDTTYYYNLSYDE